MSVNTPLTLELMKRQAQGKRKKHKKRHKHTSKQEHKHKGSWVDKLLRWIKGGN